MVKITCMVVCLGVLSGCANMAYEPAQWKLTSTERSVRNERQPIYVQSVPQLQTQAGAQWVSELIPLIIGCLRGAAAMRGGNTNFGAQQCKKEEVPLK